MCGLVRSRQCHRMDGSSHDGRGNRRESRAKTQTSQGAETAPPTDTFSRRKSLIDLRMWHFLSIFILRNQGQKDNDNRGTERTFGESEGS